MSKKNSSARKRLERIYGKGCFMERAGIRKITGYRKDSYVMTYHHMRHQSEGGKATEQNGAVLALENHMFLHSLPREEEEIINNRIRKWKANFLTMKGNGALEDSGSLDFADLTNDENSIIINLQNNTKEQDEMIKKEKERQKFNRAKIKRETHRLMYEAYNEIEDLEL